MGMEGSCFSVSAPGSEVILGKTPGYVMPLLPSPGIIIYLNLTGPAIFKKRADDPGGWLCTKT
jgi:hypothetical protein